jgi:hypothetical protein
VAGPQCHTSVTLLFVGDFCRYDLAGKRTSLWGPQNEGDASCCRLTQVREDFGRRSVSTVFIIADVVFRPQALPDAQESDDWEVLPCYREPIIRDLLTRTSAQVVLALAPPMRTPMRLGELSPRLGARLISVQTGCRCSACRFPKCRQRCYCSSRAVAPLSRRRSGPPSRSMWAISRRLHNNA